MREIKFRVWDNVKNEMVEWEVLKAGEMWLESAIKYNNEDDGSESEMKLMQYTGLIDKNGKEIYEGDEVETTYGRYELEPKGLTRSGTVIYDNKTARFAISIKNSAVLVSFYDVNKIQVTGNIYELAVMDS